MKDEKISVFGSGLIWFGAGVSIAEIMTGTLLAPLGFKKSVMAILLGHFIGCILLYLAGMIGAKSKRSGMETVKMSFGQKGSLLFSVLNVLQLIGWTAVMIIGGARAVGIVLNPIFNTSGVAIWCLLIGGLIILWISIGIKNLGKINTVTMSSLFLLTIVLSMVIFKGNGMNAVDGSMSFGAAVELSVAMPLSWLPLISDYTRYAKKARLSTAVSAIIYFVVSCWMYMIGLGAAIFTGQSDIAAIMLQAGLGIVAVVIIIASTVTTTFLDVYSAGVSFMSISKKANEKLIAVIACVIGMFLAIFTPIEQFENFLYLIGSVFAPMIAILITDFFILKRDYFDKQVCVSNILVWVIGFVIYRTFMTVDTVVGSTFPVMIATSIISIIADKIVNLTQAKESNAQ